MKNNTLKDLLKDKQPIFASKVVKYAPKRKQIKPQPMNERASICYQVCCLVSYDIIDQWEDLYIRDIISNEQLNVFKSVAKDSFDYVEGVAFKNQKLSLFYKEFEVLTEKLNQLSEFCFSTYQMNADDRLDRLFKFILRLKLAIKCIEYYDTLDRSPVDSKIKSILESRLKTATYKFNIFHDKISNGTFNLAIYDTLLHKVSRANISEYEEIIKNN